MFVKISKTNVYPGWVGTSWSQREAKWSGQNFKTSCQNNQLINLDVSQNTSLIYLEFVGNFGIAADANTIAENTQGSIILVNQTSNILGSGTGDFAVSNNAGTDGSINIALDYASVTPTNGAQVGGEVEITIITQIA